jgi:hypothetical protein
MFLLPIATRRRAFIGARPQPSVWPVGSDVEALDGERAPATVAAPTATLDP